MGTSDRLSEAVITSDPDVSKQKETLWDERSSEVVHLTLEEVFISVLYI